jgi:hypothetical protein
MNNGEIAAIVIGSVYAICHTAYALSKYLERRRQRNQVEENNNQQPLPQSQSGVNLNSEPILNIENNEVLNEQPIQSNLRITELEQDIISNHSLTQRTEYRQSSRENQQSVGNYTIR